MLARGAVALDARNDVLRASPTRFCAIPRSVNLMKRSDSTSTGSPPGTSVRAFKPRLPFEPLHALLGACRAHKRGAALVAALRAQAGRAATAQRPWSADERAICLVLADLAALGWRVSVARGVIYLLPRSLDHIDPREAKQELRESLRDGRAKQLADLSVREFLASMHAPRLFGGGVVSIEQLIDDGADLAAALRAHRLGSLSEVVRPYLQLADGTQRCAHTGLNLADIWRYFRHTWSLEYRSTPGRTINFLVRNAARPFHPVMGIVGLANAVFQLSCRDTWVGWTMPSLVGRLLNEPSFWPSFRSAALRCLREAREAIRRDDLFREVGSRGDDLSFALKLQHIADEQTKLRKDHLREEHVGGRGGGSSTRSVARLPNGERDWIAQSSLPLFKRKRAEALADILFAEHHMEKSSRRPSALTGAVVLGRSPSGDARLSWADDDLGRAVAIALREIKKNGVATRLLDVNVCGATPVYRDLLGGKLAAMSLFAREIRIEYERQYGGQASEIASAMAGRPVCKDTDLCVLTTTSLYGVGSSQYNRVRFPYAAPVLQWREIGATEGFGTLHMTRETVQALRQVGIAKAGLRNVNNQFGEGTSPLLRQLREGLSALGFQANEVLQHGQRRLVYAAELYPEARDDLLLNRASHSPRPPMEEIAGEWTRRWLAMRVQNDEVLDRIASLTPDSVRRDLGIHEVPVQRVIPLR